MNPETQAMIILQIIAAKTNLSYRQVKFFFTDIGVLGAHEASMAVDTIIEEFGYDCEHQGYQKIFWEQFGLTQDDWLIITEYADKQ